MARGSESELHFVGSLADLCRSGRKNVIVNGKSIFLIYYQNEAFALDSYCYHAGGPLYAGDIESIDPYTPSKPPKLKSKGIKQRCHKVTVQGDDLYVTLSVLPKLESDHYNKVNGNVT